MCSPHKNKKEDARRRKKQYNKLNGKDGINGK